MEKVRGCSKHHGDVLLQLLGLLFLIFKFFVNFNFNWFLTNLV